MLCIMSRVCGEAVDLTLLQVRYLAPLELQAACYLPDQRVSLSCAWPKFLKIGLKVKVTGNPVEHCDWCLYIHDLFSYN